jgi:very-short-patch-repair endonuclease
MPVKNIVVGQKITSEKKRRAKELRREMTPTENILWRRLRRNQLNNLHFRRQQIIDGFIVDFYCHSASLIVEVDGGIHETQKEQDTERDEHLISRGFQILRFKNDEISNNLPTVLEKISKARLHPSPFRGRDGDGVLEDE